MKNTISFFIYFFAFWMTPLYAADQLQSKPQMVGNLLINISNTDKYHDFEYSINEKKLNLIKEGKVVREEKDGRTYRIKQGSSFSEAWKTNRGKQYVDEKQFRTVFSQYDLTKFRKLVFQKDCEPTKSYQLKSTSTSLPNDIYPYQFTSNEQKSKMVYTFYPGGPGLLIDLNNMSMSKAFCNDNLGNVVWDSSGKYVAYAKADSKNTQNKVITVRDMINGKLILEKAIDDRVSGIAWAPSSEFVAVLTESERMGLWPWELLSAFAGHPVPHNSFYLTIYDISGTELMSQKIIGNITYGTGSIIWATE